jgi:F5/8 type C domain
LKRAWVSAAVVSLLVYAAITAVIGRDVLMHLGSSIANDPGDPLLTAAILKWNATHVPLTDAWYQFPIFYPTRDTLTFSEHLLGLSVIASPIYWLTGDVVMTYNLVLLLTYPLCAIAMYALIVRLTGSAAGGFIAGLAFGFAPYRVSQLPHIQMLATFWAPLALLGLHAYVQSGRRRWLVLYGATWVLQGASNLYALVMFSILIGLWTLWFVVLSKRWHSLLMIAVASVVAIVPLAPVLYRYAAAHSHFGFVRDYWEIRTFSADIAGLLCAPPALTFWGWVRVQCGPEGELFPGVALVLLSIVGIAGIVVRSSRSEAVQNGRIVMIARRVMLFIASVYAIVIAVLLVWGPFMFELGPLRVQASTFRKPVQIVTLTLILAVVLSPGMRAVARQSRVIGFYVLAAIVTWALALGPMTTFMGNPGIPGPYHLLMSLPGVDSLRVPARFWLMTTICLSVIAGLVVAEFMRGRSRRTSMIAVILVGLGVVSDGWIDRIHAANLPPPVPGAAGLAGATVLEAPPDEVFRDIQTVFRAVQGGWRTVNGYSGWGPSYYHALASAARALSDGMLTPFQQLGELHVLVGNDAHRFRALVERQPGVTRVTSDDSLTLYRLPRRQTNALPRTAGERLRPRELSSACSSKFLASAMDGDERSMWQCPLWDERQALTADLGEVRTVGSVVNNLGPSSWLYPGALEVATSEDGESWHVAWTGAVLDRTILAAMEDPKRLRIVLAFPPRPARFIRMRAASAGSGAPWTISELEVWSSSSESR